MGADRVIENILYMWYVIRKCCKLAVKKLRKSIVRGCKNGYTVIIDLCTDYLCERMAGQC